MANVFEHPSVIAMEALAHLEDALVMAPLCAKDLTSDFNKKAEGWKVGDSVAFKTNGEYSVTDYTSGAVTAQPISSSTRSLAIEHLYDVSVEVTAREMALDLDSFVSQVIKPAAYKLAETVDTYIGTKILQGNGLYVSDSLMSAASDLALARKAAIYQQLSSNRFCLVDSEVEAALLGQAWFNQSQTRGVDGTNTLRTGQMGSSMGMDFFSSLAFPTSSASITPGTFASTTNNTGTTNLIGLETLTVDAAGSALTLKVGDRLRIAGVRRPLVVKTAVADCTLTTTIALVDPITEIIPDGAAITVIGTGESTLKYHGAIMDDRCLGVAFPMLDLPEDRVAAVASNNGMSIRIVKGYDLTYKKTTLSMDLLVGAFALDPRKITILGEY